MSGVIGVALVTAVGVTGLLLVVTGWAQPAPSLSRALADLRRTGTSATVRESGGGRRALALVVGALRAHPRSLPSEAQLRLLDRTTEHHVLLLGLASLGGLVGPGLVSALAQQAGVLPLGWGVPALGALAGLLLGPVLVHAASVDRARTLNTDLRFQTSAYLDVVTMLLAGNTGYEGALEQASHAGDGRLFVELRRRMRDAGARGVSLTEALRRTGSELGIAELEHVAATAALSASEGAPVARSLAAKCATLRAALATEQETEARLRTSRLTTPIVGMALIFMGLVIYPALQFS